MAPHPGSMQGDHPSAPGPDTDPHDREDVSVGHYSAEGKLLTPLTKQVKAVEKKRGGKVPKQLLLNLKSRTNAGFALSTA